MKPILFLLCALLITHVVMDRPLLAQNRPGVNGVDDTPTSIDEWLDLANQLREARAGRPENAEAKQLKQREAVALFRAAFLGDESAKGRRDQLSAAVRGDASIPVELRAEVVAYSENLEVERRSRLTTAERLDGFEGVATRLIADFPTVSAGYESLLGIARLRADAEGVAAARQLLGANLAPTWVKKAAWEIVWRGELVGRTLTDLGVTVESMTAGTKLTQGTTAIVYSWTTTNAFSLWLAGEIAKHASDNVVIIGVNLDADVAAAEAAAEKLPGRQVFGYSDDGSAVRWALRMTEAPLIYLADGQGVITSVSGQSKLDALWPATPAR